MSDPSPPQPSSNTQLAKPDKVPYFNQDGFSVQLADPDAWDQVYPYQFIILHANSDGTYDVTPFRFTLPCPPESISVTMPSADTLGATLTGINEVNGGAPFRMISLSGTTGVWINRQSVVTSQGTST